MFGVGNWIIDLCFTFTLSKVNFWCLKELVIKYKRKSLWKWRYVHQSNKKTLIHHVCHDILEINIKDSFAYFKSCKKQLENNFQTRLFSKSIILFRVLASSVYFCVQFGDSNRSHFFGVWSFCLIKYKLFVHSWGGFS